MSKPPVRDLFNENLSPTELAKRYDDFQAVLTKSLSKPMPMGGHPAAEATRALAHPDITKALDVSTLRSVNSQLNKDLSLTNPLSSGYVAYDLEAPAKMLVPRPTPLRNRIPRKRGIGTAHRYKRITGITGSGTGGLGLIHPGITDATTTQFGAINYARGPKIEYAGDERTVPLFQFSMSDAVPWSAQYSGQGFEDLRRLSQMSVMWASLLAEERMLLGDRGSSAGFSGALAAPSGVSVAARTAAAGETALSGVTTNVYVKVTSESVWGESVLSAVANVAISGGQVADVTIGTIPAGATGLRVYIGTGASQPADTALFFAGRNGSNVVTITGALPTTGRTAANVTSAGDTTARAQAYDGILAYCMGSESGYTKRLNAPLSTSNPAGEFQTAFASMWESVKADPQEILASGLDRKQLSDTLKASGSNAYRITIDNATEAHNAQVGATVVAVQNQVTGSMVDLTVHPWLPQGVMPILTWDLPIPDSSVDSCWAAVNVQDLMSCVWPTTQFLYECSSYWLGALVSYAPAWNGCISGVKAAL